MFLGHYAVALGAKRLAPRTSLGTLVLGAQLLDLLWPIFLLAGWERVRIVPGLMAASALDFEHYPISHSLLAAISWAVLTGGIYFLGRRSGPAAWVLGGLVLSHWILDAPMHRPDLPLWPGSEVVVGGGLWNSVAATLALELGLLAAGAAIYLWVTSAEDRVGSWGLWGMLALLTFFLVGSLGGPPPPDERSLAFTTLGLWLFVPWAAWVDRHRTLRAWSGADQGTPTGAKAKRPAFSDS